MKYVTQRRQKVAWILVLLVLGIGVNRSQAQGPQYPYHTDVTWTKSTSQNTAGYFVYRSPFTTVCGTFTKLFTTALPNTATFYSDLNPPEGTYCYAATAVDGKGSESGLSNISSNMIIPLSPPTNFGAVVALNGNGTKDVIYTWKNPTGKIVADLIYCSNKPAIKVFFPTTKVRITTPSGTNICAVTASDIRGESGLSNKVNVVVP